MWFYLKKDKMKIKHIILWMLLFITFFSCERDDICIDPTTPKLTVKFYDVLNHQNVKSVNKLKVEIDSLGVFIPFGEVKSVDSILIPLRIDQDITKIRLTKDTDEISQVFDEWNLIYQRELRFVSRSCGYKTIFLNTENQSNTTNWMQEVEIIYQNIENEKKTHILIYH